MELSLEDRVHEAVHDDRKLKRNIFIIDDRCIAKAHDSYSHALTDYTFGNILYQHGLRVPKMRLFVPPHRWKGAVRDDGADDWYVVMQRIEGVDLRELDGAEKRRGIAKYKQELKKVLALGIYPDDADHGCNAIVDDRGDVWLIDFEFYRFGNRKELADFRRYLKGKIEFK